MEVAMNCACCGCCFRRSGEPFTDNTKVFPENGVIQFTSVTGNEQGAYLCTATNVAGTAFATVTLTVTGSSPRIQLKPSGDVIERAEGESLQLECAVEGEPTPSATWFINDVEHSRTVRLREVTLTFDLPHSPSSPISLQSYGRNILGIQSVSESDSGVYTCVAENGAGSARRQVRVVVLPNPIGTTPGVFPPSVTRQFVRVESGSRAEFRCDISGGNNDIHVTPACSRDVNDA